MTRHLIHVGYPKAGSSFLQAWFALHPEVRFSQRGLAGFDTVYEMCHPDAARRRWHVTSCEGLSAPHESMGAFLSDGVSKTSVAMAGMAARQAEVRDLLRTLYPGSTILIVTRGFRAMIFSGYSQYVRAGGTLGLEEVCRAQAEQFPREEHHYLDFDHLVRLYAEGFGAENVIVLPFELLRDDQPRFLGILEERLGLAHVELDVGRVNPSLSPGELYWYPRIGRAVSSVASRLRGAPRSRLQRWYVARSFHNRLAPVVRLLDRARPGRAVTEADVPDELLRLCAGRATLLAANPLYAPYAAEYMLG